jgi:hypothetical protein
MKLIKSKKALVLLATLVVVAAAAVGAYAYFTSTGTGSGSASVGTTTDWSVSVADVSGGPLYPGSGLENKTYTVSNASQGSQLLNEVTVEIANADGSPWTSGSCSRDDFSINGGAAGATATDTYGVDPTNDYANGAGTGAVAFTVEMVDTHVNQNDCKSTTPPILVSAS